MMANVPLASNRCFDVLGLSFDDVRVKISSHT